MTLIETPKEKCRLCYTCIRECPVKAIKMVNGQAEVIASRCIGCGNCTIVCTRNAKTYVRSLSELKELLQQNQPVAAIIAPSFPAEFTEIKDYHLLIGMIKKLGFAYISDVAFGADVIAHKYLQFFQENPSKYWITSCCPAIVSFVVKYFPEQTENIAGIVSPMIASARIVRKKFGDNVKIVFIGPCVAKKGEAKLEQLAGEVDVVITFTELRELFAELNITAENCEPLDFDGPIGGKGSIFPLSGGLLQSVNLHENLITGHVVVAEGRREINEAIKEFDSGELKKHHLDLLACHGCVMGAGMSKFGKRFARRSQIASYMRKKLKNFDWEKWQNEVDEYIELPLEIEYQPNDTRILVNTEEEKILGILEQMGKTTPEDELNCTACGYDSCREHAIAILKGLAEPEMCLPFTIEKMHRYIKKLGDVNEKLANTKDALKKTEKLATMGQLAAGIAHEVNNPMGVVLMYSHLLMEEVDKSSDIYSDLQMIASQADRCRNILGGLLNFARKKEVMKKEVVVEDMIEHCLQAVIIPSTVNIEIIHQTPNLSAALDPDQIIQVISNLVKNAIEAMQNLGTIRIITSGDAQEVHINVEDNGPGIKDEHLEKIFEPFFTTKSIGKGTGLGLAVCYGIIKMHRGQISIVSNADPEKGQTGTTFKISLPKNG